MGFLPLEFAPVFDTAWRAGSELETPLRRRQPGQLMGKPQEPVFRTYSQPARKRADAHICLSASLACQARK